MVVGHELAVVRHGVDDAFACTEHSLERVPAGADFLGADPGGIASREASVPIPHERAIGCDGVDDAVAAAHDLRERLPAVPHFNRPAPGVRAIVLVPQQVTVLRARIEMVAAAGNDLVVRVPRGARGRQDVRRGAGLGIVVAVLGERAVCADHIEGGEGWSRGSWSRWLLRSEHRSNGRVLARGRGLSHPRAFGETAGRRALGFLACANGVRDARRAGVIRCSDAVGNQTVLAEANYSTLVIELMAVEETAGGVELVAAIFIGGAACGSPADGVQIAHGRSLRVELAERGVEPRGVGVVEAEHPVFLVGEATAGLRFRFISGEQAADGGGIQVLAEVIRGARALRPVGLHDGGEFVVDPGHVGGARVIPAACRGARTASLVTHSGLKVAVKKTKFEAAVAARQLRGAANVVPRQRVDMA